MKTIRGGQTIIKDSLDHSVYLLDWSDVFAAGVELVDEGAIDVAAEWGDGSPTLEADALAVSDDNPLGVHVRLSGGINGARYRVSHLVRSNETPSQQKQKSFFVVIEDQ